MLTHRPIQDTYKTHLPPTHIFGSTSTHCVYLRQALVVHLAHADICRPVQETYTTHLLSIYIFRSILTHCVYLIHLVSTLGTCWHTDLYKTPTEHTYPLLTYLGLLRHIVCTWYTLLVHLAHAHIYRPVHGTYKTNLPFFHIHIWFYFDSLCVPQTGLVNRLGTCWHIQTCTRNLKKTITLYSHIQIYFNSIVCSWGWLC